MGWEKILSLKKKNWVDDETEAQSQREDNFF